MKILVTGAKGFIAKNLIVRLTEKYKNLELFEYHKGSDEHELAYFLERADFVFHLAGVNRPQDESEFGVGNTDLTKKILNFLTRLKRDIPFVLSSSTQASKDNSYGISKRLAEEFVNSSILKYTYIYRLPNVFGKWCKPNYNSAVATFCHNIAHDLSVNIHDPEVTLNLVYIDDVISSFISIVDAHLEGQSLKSGYVDVHPVFAVKLGNLVECIRSFKDGRETLLVERVGEGFLRALHATYLSYLDPSMFSYTVPAYSDARGNFVEVLKTIDSGQFSYFTAHPGVTRGGHYHHTKTEKFLVIKGKAMYRFRHIIDSRYYELSVDASEGPKVVETIPGWAHDITNIGEDELIVMLWANEIFDRTKPDTIQSGVMNA